MTGPEPRQRFSDRVEHYARFRPGYPAAIVPLLEREVGLERSSVVADVGSGTGLLSRLFLERGIVVYGIEPNEAMRRAAETELAAYAGFRSLSGSAETTGLPARSVDLVTAAQAFHWFDAAKTREEFARVLREDGRIALIWNTRRVDRSPFQRAYESLLLEFGTDYRQVDHRRVQQPEVLEAFFGPDGYRTARFDNEQRLDREGLLGRLLSCSYVPAAGHPRHEAMIEQLRSVFDANRDGDVVVMDYDTEVYLGQASRSDP